MTESVFSYDAMGRTTQEWQCPNTTCAPLPIELTYTYDQAGDQLSLANGITSNPITIGYSYDNAAHLQNLTSSLSTYPLLTTSTSPGSDDPFGHLINAGLDYNSSNQPVMSLLRQHDNRGRIIQETDRDGPSSGSGTVLYSFSVPAPTATAGYAPNGNLLSVNDSVMGSWSYGYDNMNRLTSANVASGSYNGTNIASASMSWTYNDPFGNRAAQNVSGTPALKTAWSHYNPANNLMTANNFTSAPLLDAAGDVNYDGINNYRYDAEGRICAVETSVGATQYFYDATGQRVMKGSIGTFNCNISSNQWSLTSSYILGKGGEQVDELNASGGWTHTNVFAGGGLFATYNTVNPSTPHYHFSDWLGSRRVQAGGASGGPEETCWNQPFGDNLVCSGSGTDATEHHFTGKERDTESGNDYFGARYYASSMGRFMSPDWDSSPVAIPYADRTNPQSFNLYSYAGNNPLSRTDPDGHCTNGGQQKGFWWCLFNDSDQDAAQARQQACSV